MDVLEQSYREAARVAVFRTPVIRFTEPEDLADTIDQLSQALQEAWQGRQPNPWPKTGLLRKTPPEIRVLWPVARRAVDQAFHGLSEIVFKEIVLSLSWALHVQQYLLNGKYREEVEEMRRIYEKPSYRKRRQEEQ
jgi:hypothetical protein